MSGSPRCPAPSRRSSPSPATTGARVAWIPRRAGERGAVEAGALPTLLPGGRSVADAAARADVAQRWGVDLDQVPAAPGRDLTGILTAARDGELGGLLVGGVDPSDLPDPALAEAALAGAGFVVSLEMFPSAVTEWADVVLPVAAAPEKAGTYLDWEGRARTFDATLHGTGQLPDGRVLQGLADEMDVDLRLPTPEAARAELAALGTSRRPGEGAGLDVRPPAAPDLGPGEARAGHLAAADRRRHPAARRARAGRHRPHAGRAHRPRHRRRAGAGRRRPAHGERGDRVGHPAGPDHRRCPTGSSGCR